MGRDASRASLGENAGIREDSLTCEEPREDGTGNSGEGL